MKTQRRGSLQTALLLVTLGSWIPALGQLTPAGDAYTDSSKPTVNFGAITTLGVANTVVSIQSSYIRFNLSSIPAGYTGSNIAKATLKLYVSSVTTAGNFNVDLVNGSWTEATLNANNAPALSTTIAASVPLTKSQVHDYVLIDVTQALQDWLDGTPNDGLALVANSPLAATFDSKENTSQSHPSELDVVFASGNGTITEIDTNPGSGLQGGTKSGVANLSLITTCSAGQTLAFDGASWGCKNAAGTGTVTSVGLTAPASDFVASGSPITTSGTLNIAWNVPPDSNNAANAIVKRDGTGSFNATNIGASGTILVNSPASLNPIYSKASAANAAAIVGFSAGGGNTNGVYGATQSSGYGSSGVIGVDQNSSGSVGNYTAGVTGVTANSFGVGVLGYGVLSGSGTGILGTRRVGIWGDDSTGTGVVAMSDTGNALLAVNASTTGATLLSKNTSTGDAVVAVNTGTAAATVLAQNTYSGTDGHGLILRAEAPNVSINGITAACQVNTRGDLGCSGDVVQTRPANGLVKALIYFDQTQPFDQQIVRCYNSLLVESAATTPPCGFTHTHVGLGINDFDFGFTVDDRFFQGTSVIQGSDTGLALGVPSGSVLRVFTFYTNGDLSPTDIAFYLTVF